MATRCTITVSSSTERFHIYRHWDGHPDTVVPDILKALDFAHALPSFEAGDFAAALIRTMKSGPGNISLCAEPAANIDRAYHFDLKGEDQAWPRLRVIDTAAGDKVIFEGGLARAAGMVWRE